VPKREEKIDRLVMPFQMFAKNKVAGAVMLILATLVALIWANSPWKELYYETLETHAGIHIGSLQIDKTLHEWINHGLMSIFFFVVGLEIKREILAGELSTKRKAALPIVAAIGGMLVPASIYLLLAGGAETIQGWGIPVATDIAFALGILLLFSSRVPIGLKIFLTALAIVDDIGAILVVAVFYTETIVFKSLLIGAVLILTSAFANRLGVRNAVFYFVVGTFVWLAFLRSGVHATLAAVLMAMTIPARTRVDGVGLVNRVEAMLAKLHRKGLPEGFGMLDKSQQKTLTQIGISVSEGTAPLQELERLQVPLVTFLVMPLFALANAGLDLSGSFTETLRDPVALGILAGLLVGKPLGIVAFSVLAVKAGWASLPENVNWTQLTAVSVLGGIGFTMSLFVSGLAFDDQAHQEHAKLAILTASTLAAVAGGVLIMRSTANSPLEED